MLQSLYSRQKQQWGWEQPLSIQLPHEGHKLYSGYERLRIPSLSPYYSSLIAQRVSQLRRVNSNQSLPPPFSALPVEEGCHYERSRVLFPPQLWSNDAEELHQGKGRCRKRELHDSAWGDWLWNRVAKFKPKDTVSKAMEILMGSI